MAAGLLLLTAGCDSTSTDDSDVTGPRTWLSEYRYALRYVSDDAIPATVFEVRDPDCLKSTVYGGSLSFGFPRDGLFRLSLNTRRTLCNREEIIETDGVTLDGRYSFSNGLLSLTQVVENIPLEPDVPWPDLTGTLSEDRDDVSLFLPVDNDLSTFPFLARTTTDTELEFRFKAEEFNLTLVAPPTSQEKVP
jgi:hypothetical protein